MVSICGSLSAAPGCVLIPLFCIHMGTFHQKDPVTLLARTMTASSGLALALCWLLAGREHRAAPLAVSASLCASPRGGQRPDAVL